MEKIKVANQKTRKAKDDVRVNLNRIYVYGCLPRLFL